MPLHPGQEKYIRQATKAIYNPDGPRIRRFLLSCANRYGKSSLIACLQLWYLFCKFGINASTDEEWFKTEYRTANIAPTSKLTQPVFKAMVAILTSSFAIQDPATGIIHTNKCRIEWFYIEERTLNTPPFKLFFINNSYIEHLSLMGNKGDTLQGLPYGIVTYDEAPRSDWLEVEIDDGIVGRLMDWIAPLHLLGTPSQVSNNASLLHYHDLYEQGLQGVDNSYTQEGSLYQNTFLTAEQIREQEALVEHNPLKNQILHGQFIFGSSTLFPAMDIEAALDPVLDDGIRYEEGHKYVVGVDTAIGSDEMVYSVIDYTRKPYRLVRQMAARGNTKSPQLHLNDFLMLVHEYRRFMPNGQSNLHVMLETFNGESVRFYHDLPPSVQSVTYCYGSWQPATAHVKTDNPLPTTRTEVKKADLLITLKKLFAEQSIRIPKHDHDQSVSRTSLKKQLAIYKEADEKIPTDRVIALALASYLAEDLGQQTQVAWTTFEEW
jgi:hypothetical protein